MTPLENWTVRGLFESGDNDCLCDLLTASARLSLLTQYAKAYPTFNSI